MDIDWTKGPIEITAGEPASENGNRWTISIGRFYVGWSLPEGPTKYGTWSL